MPCPHKFQQYLNLENLDFQPLTLIVGTFNPSWPANNAATWFYGRTARNYFWDVLPRIYEPNLNLRQGNSAQWKEFCNDRRVALTDIITSINDANQGNNNHTEILSNYLDSEIADNFHDFSFTNIIALLNNYPTIRNVYLTRQTGIGLFDAQWEIVKNYAEQHPERNLHVRNLLTPSGSARFQIGEYKAANPNDPSPLRNFIYQKWLEQWHH